MLDNEINGLFNAISKKDAKPVFGVIDRTIDVEDLVRFLKRIELLWNETPSQRDLSAEQEASKHHEEVHEKIEEPKQNDTNKSKIIDKSKLGKLEEEKHHEEEKTEEHHPKVEDAVPQVCPPDKITLTELIHIIEKYYNPKKTLASLIQSKIDQNDINSEYNTHKLTNRYYMHIKGSELIMHEFKEILLEISNLLKSKVEDGAGAKPKVRSVLKKFIEDTLIRRWSAFKAVDAGREKLKATTQKRKWPDSHKDRLIGERREAERVRQEEERKRREEEARQQLELDQMRVEDTPALSAEQLEEFKRQQELEEKLRKEQEEADALDEEDEDELDDDEVDDEDSAVADSDI